MIKNGLQIGLLIFGMTFGAGNLIFPPSLGFQSGPLFWPAVIGFIISGVGMPVVSLIMGTFNPGGFRAEMNRKISPLFPLVILTIIYLAIGPLMAIPRTAATAFSIGILPLAGDGSLQLGMYTLIYFALAWWLSVTPSKLLSYIGKVLTPIFAVMIVALFVMGLAAFTMPELVAPMGKYSDAAFGTGFIEGYNTVDTIAAFAFCIIALKTMETMQFSSRRDYYISVWAAGACVAVLMGFLYLGLALLGNHFPIPADVYGNPSINLGAYVLTQTSYALFGDIGVWFLAIMVSLTCFTTSVGLIAAVSEFFADEFPRLSYKAYVTIITLFSLGAANMGLNQIIHLTLPILLFVYPIAITVVMLIIVNKLVKLSRIGMRLAVAAAAVCAIFDIGHQYFSIAAATSVVEKLPLGMSGLGWFVPVLICIALSFVLPQKISGNVDAQ